MRQVIIKRSRYVDSVTLMGISEKVKKAEGVKKAELGMGTPVNIEFLESNGFNIPKDTTPSDLMIAIQAEETFLDKAIDLTEELLNKGLDSAKTFVDLDDEEITSDQYDIVQISLPGEYAFEEGMKALKKGLHVFMFSDNVPIEQEKIMKEYAVKHNLLCMGPDCGVALIGGLSLGAGSIFSPGRVGIVGASGSGAQEVGCLIEAFGDGVSSLIGTGGRDLTPQIGGLMMKKGIQLLDKDENTKVIVLVSKLADLTIMENVLEEADKSKKPTVAIFLGSDISSFKKHKTIITSSLEDAAVEAVKFLGIKPSTTRLSEEELKDIAAKEVAKYNSKQKYIRGLYCGGTFVEEGLIYYKKVIPSIIINSNLSTKYTTKLKYKNHSFKHTILDMGAEDFTASAPHPVFEPNLRLRRLEKELADSSVALITLDFITGPGVHEDPVTPFIELIDKYKKSSDKHITFIANICGSKLDPQNVEKLKKELKNAGVFVTFSNFETSRLAAQILKLL